MQVMMDAIAGWIALIVGLGIAAAVTVAALSAYLAPGWLSRLKSKDAFVPLDDPDPQNALAARAHVNEGRRVVDHSEWNEGTSNGSSSGDRSSGGD